MFILLSPAKTLDYSDSAIRFNSTTPRLLKESRILLSELEKLSKKDISRLMSISDKLSTSVYSYINNFDSDFNKDNSKPSILAFKGDVYKAFNFELYKKSELNFLDKNIRILSGFYGLLKPSDLMQPYRLEMSTKLKTSVGKNLYEFWGNKITNLVNKDFKESKSKYILNLASNEYFKVLNKERLKGRLIDISFKEKKGNDYRVIGLFAKRARGMMADFVVRNKITSLEKLKEFDLNGYCFSGSLSSEDEYVFIRDDSE